MTQRTMAWIGTAIVVAAMTAGTAVADEKMTKNEKKMAGDEMEMASAEVGKPAPAFMGMDQHGNEVGLADFEGKVVVLEWTCPACPFVQRHYSKDEQTMTKLAHKYGEDVVWLAVDSSNFAKAEDLAKWSEEKGIDYPILVDADGSIGRMYGAKTTPHMFIIDQKGNLAYEGAIDNNPRGKADDATNYVEAALDAILAGEKVATTSTKSYGCSVKYTKGV